MEGQSGLSELSAISWVSAFQGCPLSGVPVYYASFESPASERKACIVVMLLACDPSKISGSRG